MSIFRTQDSYVRILKMSLQVRFESPICELTTMPLIRSWGCYRFEIQQIYIKQACGDAN